MKRFRWLTLGCLAVGARCRRQGCTNGGVSRQYGNNAFDRTRFGGRSRRERIIRAQKPNPIPWHNSKNRSILRSSKAAKPSALASTLTGLSSTSPRALMAAAQWKRFPMSTPTKISTRLLMDVGRAAAPGLGSEVFSGFRSATSCFILATLKDVDDARKIHLNQTCPQASKPLFKKEKGAKRK